jgi:hypothetical protein
MLQLALIFCRRRYRQATRQKVITAVAIRHFHHISYRSEIYHILH